MSSFRECGELCSSRNTVPELKVENYDLRSESTATLYRIYRKGNSFVPVIQICKDRINQGSLWNSGSFFLK